MLFEQIRSGGCLSYLVGCEDTRAGMVIDPALDKLDRYVAFAAEKGLRLHYVFETHTHADHFSVARQLGLRCVHTPGHTEDSMCLVFPDRVLTGDTLLIGGTGRTDLPTGDPFAL